MKKNTLQKKYIALIMLAVLVIAVFTLCIFYDLKINQTLYDNTNSFGQFFGKYGELPSFLFLPFVFTVLFYSFWRKKELYFKVFAWVYMLLAFASWFLLLEKFVFDTFASLDNYVIKLLICAILNLITALGFSKIPTEINNRLAKFATAFVIIVLTTALATLLIKLTWGRVRFKSLLPDYSDYTPWYKINGFTGHKSFVSGHVSASSVLFAFLLLKKYFPKFKKYDVLIIIISSIWASLTALSRIILGAHYLSDTVGGLLLCVSIVWLYHLISIKVTSKQTFKQKDNVKL